MSQLVLARRLKKAVLARIAQEGDAGDTELLALLLVKDLLGEQ